MSVVAGIAVLAVLMLLNNRIIPEIQKLQTKQMEYKDKRTKLTNEIVTGIKVI